MVYLARNLINGKCYIGITSKSLQERKLAHLRTSNLKHPKYVFHKAIKKYGMQNFEFSELCKFASEDEGKEKEVEYIKSVNTFIPCGYNMTLGGEGVKGHRFNHSQDVRNKISQAMRGVKKSPVAVANMRIAQKKRSCHKRKPMSEESRRRISLALRNRIRRPLTDEVKEKIRMSLSGRKSDPVSVEKRRLRLIGLKRTDESKAKMSEMRRTGFLKRMSFVPMVILEEMKNQLRLGRTPHRVSSFLFKKFGYKIDKKTLDLRREVICSL